MLRRVFLGQSLEHKLMGGGAKYPATKMPHFLTANHHKGTLRDHS